MHPMTIGRIPLKTSPLTALESQQRKTLADVVSVEGVGVHAGLSARLEVRPAPAHHGIVFVRQDKAANIAAIPAKWNNVTDTRMCTVLTNEHGVSVATVEHLMAALAGCGIDDALITIDGPEIPIMDGSAAAFVALFEEAGYEISGQPRQFIRVLKTIRVEDGDKWAQLEPGSLQRFEMTIDFASAAIGRQTRALILKPSTFALDIARARTFGFLHDVQQMQKMGLGKGGSLDNAVVVDGDRILNADGLRYEDEFVRHKLLDSVGDLALAGAPIRGTYHSYKGGHALNNLLLRQLFADESQWEWAA